MAYTLVIGPKNYCCWSLCPWLVLSEAGLAFVERRLDLFAGSSWQAELRAINPAGKVPVLIDGGLAIGESLAICEYLAERHPQAQLWPADVIARARARSLAAELVSGFAALRQQLPMNCRATAPQFVPTQQASEEIERVVEIWESCRQAAEAAQGPFLFGRFGIVDAMGAPMAFRFATYGVALSGAAGCYADVLLGLRSMQRWAQEGADDTPLPRYDRFLYD